MRLKSLQKTKVRTWILLPSLGCVQWEYVLFLQQRQTEIISLKVTNKLSSSVHFQIADKLHVNVRATRGLSIKEQQFFPPVYLINLLIVQLVLEFLNTTNMQQVELIHSFKDVHIQQLQYLKIGKWLTSLNQFHYQLNEQKKLWQTSTLTYDKPHRQSVEIWGRLIF